MRKYDIKNKRNIGIIIGISVIIIIMFSLIIKLFLSHDHREYLVDTGSLIFDKDKTIVKLDKSGIIKKKWNNDYYLTYNDKSILLGAAAISYNEDTGKIVLYGKYYEIGAGDDIVVTDGETEIKSSALTKFYKLADRKYLVIDKEIKTTDGLLSTTDFLLVDLDKVGNATLTNHKVSLKSFGGTTIVTSNYTFDVQNEILTYGSNKIDLKKIIGSSNTYTKEELIPEENKGSSSDNITNIGTNKTENKPGDSSGENKTGTTVVEEVKKATKRTSVISTNSTTNKITIDYVIYDPKKEYTSVYMEVNEEGTNKIDTIHLTASDTKYEINNLFPNTKYNLTFKYSYLDEENNLKTDVFDNISVTTKKPKINLKVTNISNGNIKYLITTDNTYNIEKGTIKVFINNELVSSSTISINGNTTESININPVSGDLIEIQITDVISGDRIIKEVKSSDKFVY